MKYWITILNNEFNKNNNLTHIDFLKAHEDIVPGANRDRKRRNVKSALDTIKNRNKVLNNNFNSSVSYNSKDESYIYNRIIEIADDKTITPEVMLKAHNLSTKDWDVVTYKNNFWNSQQKDNKIVTLYQSNLVVKPKKQNELTFEDIDNYISNKDWNIKPSEPKFKFNNSEDYLEIDLTDSHIGLLSYNLETGEDYDVKIATDRVKSLFLDIINRCKGKKFKGITLATLGDILHVDNTANTTAHGTSQDVEGRITKWYGDALDMMVYCIDLVLSLGAPVKYMYLMGNHDTSSGGMLALSLKKIYEKNPNIEFDVRPLPQKAVVYGNTLVGLCHGDQAKKATSSWILNDYRKEFGKTRFAHIHCGHLHSEAVKDDRGILIYRLPSVCASSFWEKQQGYSAERGMMCFVYNEKYGLRDIWYNYI